MELSFVTVPLDQGEDASLLSARRVEYGEDAYTWALQQAALLRAKRFEELDLANFADEITDVAGREYDKLESALIRVIQHLLKWDFQPERRSRNRVLTIREHRRRIERQLRKNPGLKSVLPDMLVEAYEDARDEALRETELDEAVLPDTLAYAWDEIMHREVTWPAS